MANSSEALELLKAQKEEWKMMADNYTALNQVKTKTFSFSECEVRVQFNPGRIVSSSAKVDAKTIQERKCFLCAENRPKVQRGLPFGEKYEVLVNPFPIFPQHLTIPSKHHELQLIKAHYGDMLAMAHSMQEFTFFYNGPKCGASAPDHLHFQAGNKGFLPIEKEWKSVEQEILYRHKGVAVYRLFSFLRNAFVIESESKEASERVFSLIYQELVAKSELSEPMLNVLCWFEKGEWVTAVFPRELHRPHCYTAEGEDNILISPASVDMGGVFITPLEKDFNKITATDIQQIMKEVSVSNAQMDKWSKNLMDVL